jgi:O-antigen/teichoic acid export membrane protein
MLLRQTLLYLPAQVITPLVQLASVLIWAYLLTPQDLGAVTLIIALQEICYAAIFGYWGFYTLRYIASFNEPTARLVFLRTESAAILMSVMLQAAVAAPLLILVLGKHLDSPLVAMAVAFMLTRSLNTYSADRARAETQIMLYSMMQIIGPVFGFFIGLFFIWQVGPSVNNVLTGFVIAQAIGFIVAVLLSDFGRRIGRISSDIIKTAFSFGGTQTLSQMLAITAINAPRFIVQHTLGLAAVGVFSVGYGLGLRASSFAVTLVTAGAYPLVVRKMEREGRDAAFAQLSQNMILVALVVAPVALGLLAITPSLVHLLIATEYREATLLVLPLATIGGLFRHLRAHTSDQVFLLNLRPGFGTIIAVCDLAVAVASAIIGISVMGVVGAALGPMMSGLVTFTVSFALSRMKFGFHAPFAAFGKIGLSAVVMAAAIYWLPVAHSLFVLGAYVAVGGTVYVAMLHFMMPGQAQVVLNKILKRRRNEGAMDPA